jgi:hypothetical protein
MVGIAVGKTELHGTWRDPATQRIRWQGVVPTTAAGIRQVPRRTAGATIVVAPTGGTGSH